MTEPLQQLREAGTSPWLDRLHRDLIQDGSLGRWIDQQAITGIMTSPRFLADRLPDSDAYDDSIRDYMAQHPDGHLQELYLHQLLEDVCAAADALRPRFEESRGAEGWVSVHLPPEPLSEGSQSLVEQASLYRQRIDRKNVLIQIPATDTGVAAIRECIARGYSVHITHIYSEAQCRDAAEATMAGLRTCLSKNQPVSKVKVVYSYHLRPLDEKIAHLLPAHSKERDQTAIATARLLYEQFQLMFGRPFNDLKQEGASPPLLLWSETEGEGEGMDDLRYVESLIGPRTAVALSPSTLALFQSCGKIGMTVVENMEEAEEHLKQLRGLGLDVNGLCRDLQLEAMARFRQDHECVMTRFQQKRNQLLIPSGGAE